MTRTFQHGEPVWIELSTNDPAGAEAFYSSLLGWQVRQEKLAHGTYRMCTVDGRDVAGILDAEVLHDGHAHGWITYFAVDDIGLAVQRATTLGGEILMPPRYLPAAGTGAIIVDPLGAVFGLYQGESRVGVELLNSAGSLCWNELDTGEPHKSIAFYAELFGLSVEHRDSATQRPYAVLLQGEHAVAGVLAMENEWPIEIPARWITYLSVADLDLALEQVRALGGTPTIGPFQTSHGRLQLVRDPERNTVCLVQLSTRLRQSTDSQTEAVDQ